MNELLEAWAGRAATKLFDPSRSISPTDWTTLLSVLELSPSSYGLQPYRVVDVKDPELRRSLREAGFGQSQFTDADRFLVFATVDGFGTSHLDAHLGRLAAKRGTSPEALEAYRSKVLDRVLRVLSPEQLAAWQARQAYIALGALLLAGAQLGIDTCPMEALDLEATDRILGLRAKGLSAVVGLALGYRAATESYSKLAKVRLPLAELLLEA